MCEYDEISMTTMARMLATAADTGSEHEPQQIVPPTGVLE